MSQITNKDQLCFKIMFDGYDLLQTQFGMSFIPTKLQQTIVQKTYMSNLYEDVDSFLEFCNIPNPKYINGLNKYRVGLYRLSDSSNDKNPWRNRKYILFNSRVLEKLYIEHPEIKQVSFWVCPAFNERGYCDAIGFRIVNAVLIKNSFKWLFPLGNNIIYGKNTVDKNKRCYVVEGFRDYVAMTELGYNVIGLGSVDISPLQEKYIKTLKEPVLLFDADRIGLFKTLQYKDRYKIATLVQTPEKDIWDTYSKGLPVIISEIT